MTEYEEKIVAKVKEHGWSHTHVFDQNGVDPDFSYTIGWSKTIKQPDVIITGLSNELCSSMLWALYRMAEGGEQLSHGAAFSDLLEGDFQCYLIDVDKKHLEDDWFNSARWFHNNFANVNEPFQARQLVWPGAQTNAYPWEDKDLAIAQPLLGKF